MGMLSFFKHKEEAEEPVENIEPVEQAEEFRPAFQEPLSFSQPSMTAGSSDMQLMLTKLELINQRLEVIDRRLQVIESIAKENK